MVFTVISNVNSRAINEESKSEIVPTLNQNRSGIEGIQEGNSISNLMMMIRQVENKQKKRPEATVFPNATRTATAEKRRKRSVTEPGCYEGFRLAYKLPSGKLIAKIICKVSTISACSDRIPVYGFAKCEPILKIVEGIAVPSGCACATLNRT